MDQTPVKSNDWLDGIAVGLSGLCVVHCLALPLVVGALPLLAPLSAGHWHAQMLIMVVPLSLLAVGIGYRRHRNLRVIAGAVAGLCLLIVGATVAHSTLGIVADRVFTISGSLVLATAHFFNSLLSRRCRIATLNA